MASDCQQIPLWVAFALRFRGREGILILLMRYIGADADAAAAKHTIVLNDRVTWFALIPLDIRRLVLELVPCHDVRRPIIVCEHLSINSSIISRKVIAGTDLPESIVAPRLNRYERYVITCYLGGVQHSETRPAVVITGTNFTHIYWYRHGAMDCSRGYSSRHICCPGLFYLGNDENYPAIHETYAREVERYDHRARPHDEWQTVWQRVREADPWPVGARYT